MTVNALVTELVGAEHIEQYMKDAEFHAEIVHLAEMLPLWIDAIAKKCAVAEAERNRYMHILEETYYAWGFSNPHGLPEVPIQGVAE